MPNPDFREPSFILFLGAAGVAHPFGASYEDELSQLPLLTAFLKHHPQIQVVYLSDWAVWSQPLLAGRSFFNHMFSKELEPRARHFRFALPATAKWFDDVPQQVKCFAREFECLAYMAQLGKGRPWLAVDHQLGLFSPECPWIQRVDGAVGIQPAEIEVLTLRVRALEQAWQDDPSRFVVPPMLLDVCTDRGVYIGPKPREELDIATA